MTRQLLLKSMKRRQILLPFFAFLFALCYPQHARSESYTLSVGQSVTITQTAYNGGYIDNVGLADYLDPHLGFTKNYDGSATITVNSYFDYTATVKLVFIERYQSYYSGRNHTLAYTYYKDITIKCNYQKPDPTKKPTKVILPERIRVNVFSGGERDYITPILEPNGAKGTKYYWGNDQGTAVFAARTMDDGRCWVTGRSPGIGRVYVVVDDDWDNLYASAVLEVVDQNHLPPNSIFLPSEIEISVSGSSTLTPTLVPENTSTAFTWKSEDESIATVNYGKVTGKKTGTTTIKVTTTNQLTATCTVRVVSRNGKDDEEGGDNNTGGSVGGHDYVDLGLSVKWATCNVGATTPEGFGIYYAWGETTEKSSYTWSTYKHCGGSMLNVYDIGSDIKGTSYDAAYVNWGIDWRMPTENEMGELVSKCTFKEETQNGVDGYLVTGPNGSSVFFPSAGVMKDNKEGGCRYWTSTVHSGDYGMSLLITKNKNNVISPSVTSQMRSFGLPIRAVTTASGSSTVEPKLTLSANPSSGSIEKGTKVYLTAKADGSTVSGCDIYYTLNGTTPTKSSTKYTSSGITINSDCTLKAIAYKSGYEDSGVLTATYTINDTPKSKLVLSASPGSGQVEKGTTVILSARADGSTEGNGHTEHVKTTVWKNYTSLGDIYWNGAYRFASKSNSTGNELYSVSQDVWDRMKSETFYVTIMGSSPQIRVTSGWWSIIWTGGDIVPGNEQLTKNGDGTWTLTVNLAGDPILDVLDEQHLLFTGEGYSVEEIYFIEKEWLEAFDCDIYYTLNGNTPSKSSTMYTSSGITINSDCTLKAIAYKDGYTESDVLSESYSIIDTKGIQVIASEYNSAILKQDGSLWLNGLNKEGQIGDGTTTDRNILVKVMEDVDTVTVYPGAFGSYGYTIALKKDGSLWGWGCNMGLIDGTNNRTMLSPYKMMENIQSFFADEDVRYAIKKDGGLYAWGERILDDTNGLNLTEWNTPQKIMEDVADVKGRHILKKDGTLWSDRKSIVQVMDNVSSIIYGKWGDDFAIKQDKTLWRLDESTTKVADNVKSVFALRNSVFIIKNDNSLWVYGGNSYGQLGDGTKENRDFPKKIMDGVRFVTCNDANTFILKTDGSLYGCGRNSSGLLGNGTNKERLFPELVARDVIYVSSELYAEHVLFVKADGSVWACGGDGYGLLGTGAKYEEFWEPVKVLDNIFIADCNLCISDAGYATFFSSESAYALPNGLSASVVTGAANNKLTYRTFADNVVPKNVPVMIESDVKRAGTYTLTTTESNATYSGTNLLRGSDEATTTTGDGYHYKLSYGKSGSNLSNVFGWYWGTQNGAPFQIEGHKAWLVVPNSAASTRGFTAEGDATDIAGFNVDTEEPEYYDLQGRRIEKPTAKGVYIKNGKKITI